MTHAVDETKRVDELRLLEAEAVHIIREVVAELERPVLLFSAGKDSIVVWEANVQRVGRSCVRLEILNGLDVVIVVEVAKSLAQRIAVTAPALCPASSESAAVA